MPRPLRASPDRILAAAAVEFAQRGFGGARVDRIARRARVNKAMLYYHFKSKDALYRALLRSVFAVGAERLQAVAASIAPPAEKVTRVIGELSAFIHEHEHFPPIMLREIAEGGSHLDAETVATIAKLPAAFGAIVREGTAAGEFDAVNPLFAYFTMIAPIVFYNASAPIRAEAAERGLAHIRDAGPDAFFTHMQNTVRRMLARDAGPAEVTRS